MLAFDEIYYDDIVYKQGDIFFDVRDKLPGVDEKWFIEAFMRSKVRALMYTANPYLAGRTSLEIIDYFVDTEMDGAYKRGEEWCGMIPKWAGVMYGHLQFKYSIPSSDLISLFTLDDMERVYPAYHQMGWEAASERIYNDWIMS